MSWMAKLYETYEAAMQLDLDGDASLLPVSHTIQNAHINIVIDGEGNFLRAEVLEKTPVIIPATEASAGRSGTKPPPHPLMDKLQYVAKDYPIFGGKKWFDFDSYQQLLGEWCASEQSHPKAKTVYRYITKGQVIADLVEAGILHVDINNRLLDQWEGEDETPRIFKVLPKTRKLTDQGSALVAWSVEVPGETEAKTWMDESLQQSWIDYEASQGNREGLCFIAGDRQPLASSHPAKLRHSGDSAKLISANDLSGFTFRGRFTDSKKNLEKYGNQAASVGFLTTQKAHNALRWLIARQGYRNGDQSYVSWAVSGRQIPKPTESSWDLLGNELELEDESSRGKEEAKPDYSRNVGAAFANQLNRYMAGYRAKLNPTEDIVVMGLDSATPGRMSVIYYRELMASEFLDRLTRWHSEFAWHQRHKRELPTGGRKKPKSITIWPIASPAPRNIAETAYGATLTDELKKRVAERIMPCIIDALPFPRDLLDNSVRRVTNRAGYKSDEFWRWEQDLGVACALYRGYFVRHPNPNMRKEYSMSLEENNHSRDYLYGRLLAIAERIEEVALSVGGENRTTTAARLMQRFADRPYSTWRTIELALNPYMQRLQASRTGFLVNRKKELDSVLAAFDRDEFTSDKPLTGEFLLAYHCQRMARSDNSTQEDSDSSKEEK